MSTIERYPDHPHTPAVSYSLNGYQPVVSTFIGVVEFTEPTKAEEEKADLAFLESAYESFFQEMEQLSQLSSKFSFCSGEYYDQFEQARNSITGQDPYRCASLNTVEDLLAVLRTTHIGRSYLDHAARFDLTFAFDPHVQTAFYDRTHSVIRVNPNLCETYKVLLSLYELRRHWQHRQGALLSPLMFAPDSAILVNRLQQADLISNMLRGAWELKLSGYRDPWKFIQNSAYKDLARAFSREAHLDFRTIQNGFATLTAFETWFMSERCTSTDKSLIRMMLTDTQEYVFDIHAEHSLMTPALITALGTVPFGKNYLSSHINAIMTDTFFTDVRDRTNANFLWFIKFERTFRETEHDLQSAFSAAASLDAKPDELKQMQSSSDDADIITLYDTETAPSPATAGTVCGSTGEISPGAISGENIIYLRRQPDGRHS